MPESRDRLDLTHWTGGVPEPLRRSPLWVAWRYVERSGKWTKVPICAATGGPASSTDSATGGTFEQTLIAFQARADLEGIGFVFTQDDPFAGVDLDGCIVEGEVMAEARLIADTRSKATPRYRQRMPRPRGSTSSRSWTAWAY